MFAYLVFCGNKLSSGLSGREIDAIFEMRSSSFVLTECLVC